MLVASFFSWWYGAGWRGVLNGFGRRSQAVTDLFSVKQLLRTIFAPWRRIVTQPGANIADRFRAWGDNLVSRVIGFVVRLIVLFAASLTLLFVLVGTAVESLIWPLLPLAAPILIIIGVVG